MNDVNEKQSLVRGMFEGADLSGVRQIIGVAEGDVYYQKYGEKAAEGSSRTMEEALDAYRDCRSFTWGASSIATLFCVCRDFYGFDVNMSDFERRAIKAGEDIKPGTIASAMRYNPYMKTHVKNWEKQHAMERVMVLVKELRKRLGEDEAS